MILLALFSLALSIGIGVVVLVVRQANWKDPKPKSDRADCPFSKSCFVRRPDCWLAIKSRSVLAVQTALGLHNAKPCSWIEGFMSDRKLFIAPPVKGWILVMGSGLPDPSDDVDSCFRFITALSRQLGHVQLFSTNRVVNHHAWVHARSGRVIRAYAWAGKTLWHQGRRTAAEGELGLKCFDYHETAERPLFGQPDILAANAEKVPLLAARWSLDPAKIEEAFLEKERGVAGEPSRWF
jgi:hypothetical protein